MIVFIRSGHLRGHRLATLPNIRPTTSRLREALFSYLRDGVSVPNWCHDAQILDLFSGSGSLGLEALSCEAKSVLFVEQSKNVCKILRNNIKNLHCEKQTIIWNKSAWHLSNPPEYFLLQTQLIMMDPPYKQPYFRWKALIKRILKQQWLSTKGIFMIETPQKSVSLLVEYFARDFGTIHCIRCLKAGDSAMILWQKS